MTKNPYANSDETQELLWMGAVLELLTLIIKSTKGIKEFTDPLQQAHDIAQKVRDARYEFLDEKTRAKLQKRCATGYGLCQRSCDLSTMGAKATVDEWLLNELCEVATTDHCYGCSGKNKGKCKVYGCLHGMVCPANNPKAKRGQCEYAIEALRR